MAERFEMRVPDGWGARVDVVRGSRSRGAWVKAVVEDALPKGSGEKVPWTRTGFDDGRDPSDVEGLRLAEEKFEASLSEHMSEVVRSSPLTRERPKPPAIPGVAPARAFTGKRMSPDALARQASLNRGKS